VNPGDKPAPLDPTQRAEVLAIVARHRQRPGPLLEILHDVQRLLGFVPAEAVPLIAAELNVSRADVHGVVSFYHYFRATPPGRRMCRAEACQAMNGRALETHVLQRLGIGFGETTPDQGITLEAVYCLGLCACAPAVMIDGEVHGRVTPQRLAELVEPATGVVKS
jgi:formate dehydrogenase subunit gamma